MDETKDKRRVIIVCAGGLSNRSLMLAAAMAVAQVRVVAIDIEAQSPHVVGFDGLKAVDLIDLKCYEPTPLAHVEYKGRGKGDKKKARAALRRQWGIK